MDNQVGSSIATRSIAFGQADGSGFSGDATLAFLTGSGNGPSGLFYGNSIFQTAGGTAVPAIHAGAGDVMGAGSGSVAFNQARIMLSGSTSVQLVGTSAANNAVIIDAVNGGIDMDAGGAIAIDGVGISLDSDGTAANLTVASDGAGEDLTIEVTGATDSSVLIKSSGTGTDAVSIDATAGSMVIAASLANEKTLTIGPSSATQMVFTPHGTAANEKISLTNTAGTADDAISIVSTAGGVTVQAGNDSLVIDAKRY